jgi:type IV pilus assembly protein PilB
MTTNTLSAPETPVATKSTPQPRARGGWKQGPSTVAAPLGQRLIQAELITAEELETALKQQSSKNLQLGESLVDLGFIKESELLPFLQRQLSIPAVQLRDGLIDPLAVPLLPRAKAEALNAVVMFKVRDHVTVAMAEPQNLQQIDELERITKFKVRPVIALRSEIQRMISRCYQAGFEVDVVTADLEEGAVEFDVDAIEMSLADVESLAEGSPIINLVNFMIVHAVRQGASDIHIEPGTKHTAIRFRIDGQLREVLRPRRDFHPAIISRVKLMAKMDIAEHRQPQDGRMHVVVEGREIDLRASTLPTVLGEKAVLRILDKQNVTFNLDQLGVPERQLVQVKQMLAKPYGLMLVTGPTGSGKTTTLYSALELIKSVTRNIITVEDPVEYQLELINQVQADSATNMTFASALRSILRQDPDVIMVGEIRDRETAEVAIQAALTGHLVLSTLHTNDSAAAVTRLLDMGIVGYKIAASLVGVIAQRLVRNICQHCKTAYYPPAEILEMIRYEGDKRRQFTRGSGCNECHDSGCRGRTGIYEVLMCTPALRDLISDEVSVDAIRACHRSQGGETLLHAGIRLAEMGRTSLDEIISTAFFE